MAVTNKNVRYNCGFIMKCATKPHIFEHFVLCREAYTLWDLSYSGQVTQWATGCVV